ncbi:hypothetical protein FA13DRAFT_1737159 [Coprinellus micaceus]|uniref:Protein kinase domain-containing protein n=1 Tax=Coprinellus micaceus TaxID=71717 RepID=A0A4Y7SY01_COPMI|nr:hypothetical protein FA13DRAFT_1737159 [Coprinellus micaceus]
MTGLPFGAPPLTYLVQFLPFLPSFMLPPYSDQHILWVFGYAGCGKSAVAQAVAARLEEERCLGDRSRMSKFAETIASQISTSIDGTARHIQAALIAHPGLLQPTTSPIIQFKHLVYDPIVAVSATRYRPMGIWRPYTILIDGFDECEDREGASEWIKDLILFFGRNPRLPLRFIFTSRVEDHIHMRLYNASQVCLLNLVDRTSEEDILTALDAVIAEAKASRVLVSIGDAWLSPEDKRELIRHIGGSFIFLTTIAKFLFAPSSTDGRTPPERLPLALNMNPGFDSLYSGILESAQHFSHFLDIARTLAVMRRPLSAVEIADLLVIEVGKVVNVLVELHAIIQVPGDDHTPVTLWHSSLQEFLKDERRSGPYAASPEHHERIACRCIELAMPFTAPLGAHPCCVVRKGVRMGPLSACHTRLPRAEWHKHRRRAFHSNARKGNLPSRSTSRRHGYPIYYGVHSLSATDAVFLRRHLRRSGIFFVPLKHHKRLMLRCTDLVTQTSPSGNCPASTYAGQYSSTCVQGRRAFFTLAKPDIIDDLYNSMLSGAGAIVLDIVREIRRPPILKSLSTLRGIVHLPDDSDTHLPLTLCHSSFRDFIAIKYPLPQNYASVGPGQLNGYTFPGKAQRQSPWEDSSYIYRGTMKDSTGKVKRVAVKVIRADEITHDPAYINTLQRHRSPPSPTSCRGWSFPWCDNGTVLNFVQKYPETQRIPLIKGVASGLHYMHCLNAVHGDIKSANILISDDFRPLLTDFSFSKILYRREFDADLEFTLQYAAPEILDLPVENEGAGGNGQERIGSTKETDVWAFGMVGAEIVGGQEVFARVRLLHLPPFVLKGGRPKKADFPNISGDADVVWSLLEMCWNHDPGLRPTMEGILHSLS